MAADNDFSDNEIDAFDSRNERVLLDQAGDYLRGNSSDEDSEEEVLGLKHQNNDDSEDESASDGSEVEGEEEENDAEERWGSKKNYYGGDDVSDDDGGAEMAEEALRQQKKHLQALEMDDFVDEEMMQDWEKSAAQFDHQDTTTSGAVVEEKTVDFDTLDEDEKLKHLNGQHPEFVPLLKEFNNLTPKLETLKLNLEDALSHAKYVALLAYLSSISSYFSIFVDLLRAKQKFSMKENPVMESILSTREVWRQASEISSSVSKTPVDGDSEDEEMSEVSEISDAEEGSGKSEFAEFDEFSDDGKLQTDSEDELGLEMEDSDLDSETDANLNIDVTAKRAIKKPQAVASGDYTETATPDSVDKEEKDRRKKSLRFYTSKIDQAAKKNAANERFDGDLDLPYRERLFERQQRLLEEARKKGLGKDKLQLGEDLDGEDYGSGDEKLANAINEDADDYYESIKNSKSATKEARKIAHEKVKKAARLGKLGELAENADEHGKRALNFQILKNKGLTPNRRNDNRNARVKKRKRYDQAQKKLKSVRQVYDESNRGPYQGEKTGIKKGLSRSVRLN